MRLPRPSSTLQSFPFSAGRVLFWPAGGRVWVLNETAAFIWDLLEEGKDNRNTAETEFAAAFSVPLQIAGSAIETALSGFSDQGLLAGGTPGPSACDDPCPFEAHGPRLPKRNAWSFAHAFALAGHQFSICAESPLPRKSLFALLPPSRFGPLFPQTEMTAITVITTPADGGSCDIYADGRLCFHAIKPESLVPVLMTLIYSRVSRSLSYCMLFHAAVLVRDGQALLLPAGSGSGKTTLAAILAARGWTFFSDELAPIAPVTGEVLALPMPMSIKQGSLHPLSGHYPHLERYPAWLRPDGRQVRYLLPPGTSLPEESQRNRIHKIVFPHFHGKKDLPIEPLDKVAALEGLAAAGSSDRPLQASDVKLMIDLVETAESYRLVFSDTDAAILKIEGLSW